MPPTDLRDVVADTLNQTPRVEEALTTVLRLLCERLGFDGGWVWLLDKDSGRFFRAASHNLPPYLEQPLHMAGSDCWCMREFKDGDLIPRNVSIMTCSRLREAGRAKALTRGLRSHVTVPLYFQSRPQGIMNLTRVVGHRTSDAELRGVATVAAQLGVALERERLAEEGRRLARAEERARMAREVHDTLAQRLTAIGLGIEGACAWLERDPERANALLTRALEVTRGGLEEVRRSVGAMRVSALAGKPLDEAVSTLARGFTADSGIPVRLRVALAAPLALQTEAELYRIAQEALTNVMRHADARQVELDLVADERGNVRLSVRDDGRGFDEHAARPDAHGLRGMRERARLIGGRLYIRAQAGRGTRVTVKVSA